MSSFICNPIQSNNPSRFHLFFVSTITKRAILASYIRGVSQTIAASTSESRDSNLSGLWQIPDQELQRCYSKSFFHTLRQSKHIVNDHGDQKQHTSLQQLQSTSKADNKELRVQVC